MINRKINMGMVGGGKDAFIGAIHRMAATLDGEIQLVCGAFSSNPEKSKASGKALYLPENRVYGTYQEMIDREKELPEGERMDFVAIVTPNFMHFPPAKYALENGFHVMCDKPMTLNLAEAKELQGLVEKTGLQFGLTHNYTGYPMVKEAKFLVESGQVGEVRKIVVEYPQGWLATKLEDDNKQADWRTDPARAGIAGCMGDIGTHAENLAEYITGLQITELCADLTTFVPGRQLDDDGNVLLRFNNGARGILYASQISVGDENNLRIRIYGTKAGLEWYQVEPNTLTIKWLNAPTEIRRTNIGPWLSEQSTSMSRLPAGHPEGFIEAFANIYRSFAFALRRKAKGEALTIADGYFPTVYDGVRGMAFIENVVASSNGTEKWRKFTV